MSEKERKAKIVTFSRVMSMEEAEREKASGSALGESLKRADKEYEKRRKK